MIVSFMLKPPARRQVGVDGNLVNAMLHSINVKEQLLVFAMQFNHVSLIILLIFLGFLYNGNCLSTGCESQYSSLDCLK